MREKDLQDYFNELKVTRDYSSVYEDILDLIKDPFIGNLLIRYSDYQGSVNRGLFEFVKRNIDINPYCKDIYKKCLGKLWRICNDFTNLLSGYETLIKFLWRREDWDLYFLRQNKELFYFIKNSAEIKDADYRQHGLYERVVGKEHRKLLNAFLEKMHPYSKEIWNRLLQYFYPTYNNIDLHYTLEKICEEKNWGFLKNNKKLKTFVGKHKELDERCFLLYISYTNPTSNSVLDLILKWERLDLLSKCPRAYRELLDNTFLGNRRPEILSIKKEGIYFRRGFVPTKDIVKFYNRRNEKKIVFPEPSLWK